MFAQEIRAVAKDLLNLPGEINPAAFGRKRVHDIGRIFDQPAVVGFVLRDGRLTFPQGGQ